MNTQFKVIAFFIFAIGIHPATAAPTAQDKADASYINSACALDAKTAGCSGEVVGQGLLICIRKYKQANSSFKVSPDCAAAVNKLRSDKRAGE